MRCYGYIDEEQLGGTPVPQRAMTFPSIDHAVKKLHWRAVSHFRISEKPLRLCLFLGEPDGFEDRHGYPDEPDRVYEATPTGAGSDFVIRKAAGCAA